MASLQFHFPQSFVPTTNNGMPTVLYRFFFVYQTFADAGSMERRRDDYAIERPETNLTTRTVVILSEVAVRA